MDIFENIRIAVFSIKTNLMRSLLTMLGIIIGVASVIAIITVGQGGRDYIVGMIKDMGASCVQFTVDTSVASKSDYVTEKDIEALRNLESVEYVSPMNMTMGTMESRTTSGMAMVMGGSHELGKMLNMTPKYGRFPTNEEGANGKMVAVIDPMSAYTFFGKENAVGESITLNSITGTTLTFKIVGVVDMTAMMGSSEDMALMMEQSKDMMTVTGGMLIIPSTIVADLNGNPGAYESLYLSAVDESQLESVGESAVKLMKVRHNNADRDLYKYINLATYIELLNTVINVFTIFIAAVSAISLIVGGIGVMNIMLVSVTERTREIGIRKALGAKTRTIMFQFLTESVILCLIGGLVGMALGVGGAMLVSYVMKIPLAIHFSTIAIAVGFSSAIGIFFGINPARRAAKMLPIEALRRE